jgi:hypothetical protein
VKSGHHRTSTRFGTFSVANDPYPALTEINTSTGSLIRVVQGQGYDFKNCTDVVDEGSDFWVANDGSNSVVEVDGKTGKLIRLVK